MIIYVRVVDLDGKVTNEKLEFASAKEMTEYVKEQTMKVLPLEGEAKPYVHTLKEFGWEFLES